MALDEDTHLAKEHKFDATVYREIFMYENFQGKFFIVKTFSWLKVPTKII